MCLKLSILTSQSYITRNIYKPKLFPICLNPTKIKNTNNIVVNTTSLSVHAPYILPCTPFFWTASCKHNTGKEPPSWTEPHALPGTPFFWNACHKHHTGTANLHEQHHMFSQSFHTSEILLTVLTVGASPFKSTFAPISFFSRTTFIFMTKYNFSASNPLFIRALGG